jgi:hypothetical protein
LFPKKSAPNFPDSEFSPCFYNSIAYLGIHLWIAARLRLRFLPLTSSRMHCVPPGNVLGSLPLIVYTTLISSVISKFLIISSYMLMKFGSLFLFLLPNLSQKFHFLKRLMLKFGAGSQQILSCPNLSSIDFLLIYLLNKFPKLILLPSLSIQMSSHLLLSMLVTWVIKSDSKLSFLSYRISSSPNLVFFI